MKYEKVIKTILGITIISINTLVFINYEKQIYNIGTNNTSSEYIEYNTKQSKIEETIGEIVKEIFTNKENSIDKYKEYIEDDEYEQVTSLEKYKENSKGIESINIYSCRKFYNSDNIEKEIVDIKVDYGEYNRMFIIEFKLSYNGKIMGHKIRAY